MKNSTVWVYKVRSGQSASALCREAQAATGIRHINDGINIYRVEKHPLSTTRVMERLFPC